MRDNKLSIFKKQNNMMPNVEVLINIVEFACDCDEVLIVDDVDINKFVINEILKNRFGIKSTEAYNGKDCLR